MPTYLGPLVLIALGGVAIALQAPINAALSRSVGSPVAAAAVSFGVGFILLVALTFVGGSGAFGRLASVPVWQLAGGLLGAFYVWSMVSVVAGLGVVTAIAALIFGQLTAALLLDASGTLLGEGLSNRFEHVNAMVCVSACLIWSLL